MAREMKDSGIKWIGKIPFTWNICRIKNMISIYTGNSIRDEQKEYYEDPQDAIPYIATKDIDVTLQTINYMNGMYVKNSDDSFKRAPAQSTLLCIEGGSAGKKIAYIEQDVCFVNKLCCFHSSKLLNKFIYYYLMSSAFTQPFLSHISGLIGGVSVSDLNDFEITVPPLNEQIKITSFLDNECMKIDFVIEQTRKSIEEYKTLKQAVISQAVTKGIRSRRLMKASGVEWIGEIPYEWQNTRLGYECKEMIVPMRDKPEFVDDETGIPWCRIEDLDGKYLNGTKSGKFLSQEIIKKMNLKVFPVNTVLSACSAASVGAVALATVQCCTNQTFIGLVAGERLNHEYLYYYIFSIKPVLKSIGMGATIVYISQDIYKKLPIPLPSYEEQTEIVDYLNKKIGHIDLIIKTKESFLIELEKYKRTIIYEYVTGKKEVL